MSVLTFHKVKEDYLSGPTNKRTREQGRVCLVESQLLFSYCITLSYVVFVDFLTLSAVNYAISSWSVPFNY